jgi:hypothetical protein
MLSHSVSPKKRTSSQMLLDGNETGLVSQKDLGGLKYLKIKNLRSITLSKYAVRERTDLGTRDIA